MRNLLLIALLSLVFRPASCALVNVSIDDTFGDPVSGNHITYTPNGVWQQNVCPGCAVQPDPSLAFNGSWHFATFTPSADGSTASPVSASVQFSGVAVYVMCILTGSSANPDGNSDMAFNLDGTNFTPFERPPDGNTTYLYNQAVFSVADLSAGLHTLTLESGLNGSQALVLLDRIIYTVDSADTTSSLPSLSSSTSSPISSPAPSSSSSHAAHTGTIIGAALGAIGGVLLISIVLWWILIRNRRRRIAEEQQAGNAVEPFVVARPAAAAAAASGRQSAGGAWSETAATAAPSSDLISMNAMPSPGRAPRRVRPGDGDVTAAADYAAPSHGSGSTSNSAKMQRSPSTVAVVSHVSPSTDSGPGSSSRNEKRGRGGRDRDRDRARATQARDTSPPPPSTSSPDPTLVPSSASGSAGSSSAGRHSGSRPLPVPPAQRAVPDGDPEATAGRYRRKILDVMALTSPRGERRQNPPPSANLSDASPPPVSTDTQSTTPVSGSPITLPPRFQGGSSVVGSDLSARTAPPPYGLSEVGSPQQ